MIYEFHAYGHPNILGTHKTTLEFTKDDEASLKGDCIIGVKADFELGKIKELIRNSKSKKVSITIEAQDNKNIKEKIFAEINPDFEDDAEFVIRKTNFISKRTFAISANKAAFGLNRALIGYLKEKGNKISVIIENEV
ncbi:DUF371 domain-containing protein [Candidatus Woesearchaeota archaeon]|nr:DUF371 domain-containing protein [Candidatus Woesearchaeota archaeon]